MPTRVQGLARCAIASVLMCSAAACSGSQSAPRASLRSDVGEVPPDMRSDYESFADNCSKCHGLERALAAPVTDNRHWDIYVAKMMRTAGSAINEKEAPHILRFLYWYTDRKTGRTSAEPAQSMQEATPPPPTGQAAPSNKEESLQPAPAPEPAQPVTNETQGESTP